MATITRTFGTTLTSTYVSVSGVNPIIEVLHLRDTVFDADDQLAIYLDTAQAIIDIGSFNIAKIPNLDGDESTIEEALALSKAESESNKIGLRILTRKNNIGNWNEIAEFILLNYGRKDYLDLRTKTGFPARLLERNDALAVQLVDYGDGLLWDTDLIAVNFALSIEIEKKNNLEAIEARMAALELALKDRITNIPGGMILGRNTGIGVVEQIPQSQFVKPAELDIAIFNLIGGAPGALNTLDELAAALTDDANFATTVTNQLALKAPIDNPVFTGFLKIGNIGIKIDLFYFTSPANTINTVVAYGLPDMSKIISIEGMIHAATTDYFKPNHYGGSFYGNTKLWSLYAYATHAYVSLHPDAVSSMGNRPGKITVISIA